MFIHTFCLHMGGMERILNITGTKGTVLLLNVCIKYSRYEVCSLPNSPLGIH